MTGGSFDIAVVGGGVAGCSAAIQLAQRGHKVVLLEAQVYPHHKVCGEFLSPECELLLTDLGLKNAIQTVKPVAIHTVAITAPDGTHWETNLPGIGLGISRYVLDGIMAAQATATGVNLRNCTVVTQIEGSLDKTFQLTTRTTDGVKNIHAKTVIGAHGKRSLLDRKLNRSFLNSAPPFVGLKSHFRGSMQAGHIHLYSFPGGYCGMSEIEDSQINVCLLVRQEVFQSASRISPANTHDFIEWMKSQNPALGKQLSAMQPVTDTWLSIAQIPFVAKQVVVNEILMTGDSAALIAPVAGDGMGMALQASQLVARLVSEYLTGHLSALDLQQEYTNLWWRMFRTRLRLSRLLQEFMLRPAWLTPGLQLVNTIPVLGQLLINHTRDHRLVRS